ncbi:disease resistance RPP8-like protein 3 [Salvia splendens]|nr:disease resistance RPP8-like protein 3 [Salvia splendens]
MLGLGKTTLAGNIFHDPDIKFEFTEKEVFLSSLRQMKTQFNKDEYTKKRCSYLAKETSALLGDVGKFLLVMDDVWETTDWDKIKECLPEDNTVGKVMITSRQMDVGKHVNRFREPHPLRK